MPTKSGAYRIAIAGLTSYGAPGEPILPRRTVRLLLPAGHRLLEVSVETPAPIEVFRETVVEAGRAEHSPIDDDAPDPVTADASIYSSHETYPATSWRHLGTGRKHGRDIVLVEVCPIRYIPADETIAYLPWARVRVTSVPDPARTTHTISTAIASFDRYSLARLADNAPLLEESTRIDSSLATRKTTRKGVPASPGYVIVTSESLAPAFEPLADWRRKSGLTARVVTTEWIAENYDGTRPSGGEDLATKIRAFIADEYARGLRYVLLGGDADGDVDCEECEAPIVPARLLRSQALFADAIPSDLYYGCLDGSFDSDADGIYGEPNDGENGEDVDFLFEVHVGRAPVDSVEEAERFVEKTVAYDSVDGAHLPRVLLVGEYLGFGRQYDFGANLNDQIQLGTTIFFPSTGFEDSVHADFFRVETLSDRDAVGGRWDPEDLVERLERGVHIVNHVGHADISSVMKLTNREIDALADGPPFVAYSQSCYAGAFDNKRTHGGYGTDSVVEHFLTGPSGAVAFIANSRRGWASTLTADGPSQRFNRRFWNAVLRDSEFGWGAANDRSKEESVGDILVNERARWCAYELNTLGDPALRIRLASRRGTLVWDRPTYTVRTGAATPANVTLIDADLDTDPSAADRASVEITAESGARRTVELVESGPSSGVFSATVELRIAGENAPADTLEISPPESLGARYDDADGGDGAPRTTRATADAVRPLAIADPCPPSGSIGVPYRAAIDVRGGVPPYRFETQGGYVEASGPPNFEGIGGPRGWKEDDGVFSYALPFNFPFYGEDEEVVFVSTNGFLQFEENGGRDFANSEEALIASRRIAPLWLDIDTRGGDIYINEKVDSVTIRWAGDGYHTGVATNFEVELFRDGQIRFGYGRFGAGNGELLIAPTIGISAGDGIRFVISELSGRNLLSEAPSPVFVNTRLPNGLTIDPATGAIAGIPQEVYDGSVSLLARDSRGTKTAKICRLEIAPDGVEMTSPDDGTKWLRGSQQTIRWRFSGNIGSTARIDLATDPGGTDFSRVVATGVPFADLELPWTLPLVSSPTARLRIRSEDRPEFFTVSPTFAIVEPSLALLEPASGERWTIGEEVLVRWESFGDTGSEVRVSYNTSGGTSSFPLELDPAAPNTGTLRVTVPDTPGETCRLEIRSVQLPAMRAVSDVFAIRPPSLEVLSPNGGECLRAGDIVLVTWSQSGETGDDVVIEYNTDGDATRFPLSLSGGPIANSGSFAWEVPADVFDAGRIRVRSLIEPEIFDVSDAPFRTDRRCEIRALVWVPYIPRTDEQVTELIQAALLYEPDLDVQFSTQTTPEALRAELAGKDAFLVPLQKGASESIYQTLGRDLSPVLRSFMTAGGAVVICGQRFHSQRFLQATGFMSATRIGAGAELCEVVAPLHPVVLGVRPNFAGPISTAWFEVDGAGVIELARSRRGTVAAARSIGFGQITMLGFDYYNFNESTARILGNAIRLPLPRDGLRIIEPAPGQTFLQGDRVPIRWVGLGRGGGEVRIAYSTTGTEDVFPHEIAIAAPEDDGLGSVFWPAPPPPFGSSFTRAFLQIRPIAAPELAAEFEEPLFVALPLSIETESLPEASVGSPYLAPIVVRGGIPPYSFTHSDFPSGLVARSSGDTDFEIVGVPQSACAGCEVTIGVEDSTGLVTQRSFPLPVVVSRIEIERPRRDEIILAGSQYRVQWSATGDVGTTARITYNDDGDPNEFPFEAVASVPIADGGFTWRVPPINGTPRIRVQSNERESILDTSDRFLITGPTIRLDVPNGGECWTPGRQRTIRWSSAGIGDARVRVRYGFGPETELPHVIADDEENSGELSWIVPDEFADDVRILVEVIDDEGLADASDGPFRIGDDCSRDVVVWSPCPGAERSIETIEEAIRSLDPDGRLDTTGTRRPDRLSELLFNRDALVIPLNAICNTLDYDELGRAARAVLEPFVESGGAVVFTGVTTRTSRLLAGLGLLERLRFVASRAGLPCVVEAPLHPIVRGVPLEFAGPLSTSAYRYIESELVPLVASGDAAVVAALDRGLGRWVSLGFTFDATSTESSRVLFDSLRVRAVEDGLRISSPRTGSVYVAGETIPVEWVTRGERAGPVRLRYSTDGSTEEFPHELTSVDPPETVYEWVAPTPPDGERYRIRIEARWGDEGGLRSVSPEFFIVREPLELLVSDLPDGFLDAPYHVPLGASGGAPPYSFTVSELPAGLFLLAPDEGETEAFLTGTPIETKTGQEVIVTLRDDLGTTIAREFQLDVLPSQMEILTPAGGEYLLAGDRHQIEWIVNGYVGDALDIELEFIDDGESNRLMVAESVETTSSTIEWTVPEVESEICRLRIVSDRGHQSVTRRTFAISGPGITCLAPNGAEAYESETVRTIRWRSLGNPSERVRIELSMGGDAFDTLISEDAPDTGSYEWLVPRSPSESSRVRVTSTTDGSLRDVSDAPFAIRLRTPMRALVWTPFTDLSRLEVRGAIAAITVYENDLAWGLSTARTPEQLASELVGKESFVMVQQDPATEVNFAALGRALGEVLETFVVRGGTVVVLKQRGSANDFLPATGLFHPTEIGSEFDVPCEVAWADHPVANQVAPKFTPGTATAWYDIADPDHEVYVTADGAPVVTGRRVGDGRVVLVGFDYRDYSFDAARVLANAVRMEPYEARPRFVRGDYNADARININDAFGILNYLFGKGPPPTCFDAADVNDSAEVGDRQFPVNLSDAVHLLNWLFGDGKPPPAPSPMGVHGVSVSCGFDPQYRDDLSCEAYSPCE